MSGQEEGKKASFGFTGFSLGSNPSAPRRVAPSSTVRDAMDVDARDSDDSDGDEIQFVTAVSASGSLLSYLQSQSLVHTGRAHPPSLVLSSPSYLFPSSFAATHPFLTTFFRNRKDSKKVDFLVIPLEEGWKKKRKPAFDPSQANTDSGVEMRDVDDGDSAPSIPLQLSNARGGDDASEDDNLPALLRNRIPGIDELNDELDKFKADVEARPDIASLEDYERVPIEKFGEGMLRGMGWTPGKPIGKNNTEIVKVVQFIRRPEGLGLGAQPKAAMKEGEEKGRELTKEKDGEGERRRKPPQKMMALPVGPDGRVRHVRDIDEELVEVKEPFYEGCKVSILKGEHSGLRAVLTQRRSDGNARLRLVSEESVVVPISYLEQLPDNAKLVSDHRMKSRDGWSREQEDDRNRLRDRYHETDLELGKERGPRNEKVKPRESHSRKRSRSRSRSPSDSENRKRARIADPSQTSIPRWAVSDIRVKITSKSLFGGRLYAKSAWIVDVLPGARCSLRLDDGGALVHDVPESDLETLVPQLSGRIRVVLGTHKGERGVILERDRDKRRVQVRLDDDDSVVSLAFDECAQTSDAID